ncbi:MAG: winged helix-turn-helix transcriptional regulator [Desulfuromusa sp.]|nr:winged helix-turn-helix transcriptional regulator [Desulfuromusa sp.]
MSYGACEVLKVIGDLSRFKILEYLLDEPRNVSEIIWEVGLQQSLVSQKTDLERIVDRNVRKIKNSNDGE